MESEHFECPVCLVQFNRAENIPKIVSCGHTICSACLGSIFAAKKERMCPLDRKSLDAEITVEALPTNIILLQLLEAKPASEFEQCPIHKEPAKMVCITDKCLVCKYCGPKYSETHKDHKLVHYNDVKQRVVSKKQSLLKQLKGLDDKPKDLQKKVIDSQKQVKLEIEQNYANIQILLTHKMKRILKQVDTFFTIEQSQLEDKMKNSDLKKEEIRKNLTLLNKNQTISNEVLEILEKEESQDSESSASDESESYEALLQETSKKVKHELTELEQYVVKSSETLRSIFLTEKSFNYTEENSPNLFFYQNKIEAKPTNVFLKDFHEAW